VTDATAHTIPPAAVETFDDGARAYLTDDNAAAIERFGEAIAADARFAEAHYMLGLAQIRAGNRPAAIAALKQAAATTTNIMLRDYAVKKLARLGEAA